MPQAERKDGSLTVRENLAVLDVKNADREPILNDGLVARIGEILGQAAVVWDKKFFIDQWCLTTPDGKIMDFCVFPTRRGRVSSADVLAHDSVKIAYKDGEIAKTAYMKGISAIGMIKDDDGTVAVEFVQKTDKGTRRIEVSDKGVVVGGNGTRSSIPHRFTKDFYFI